MPYTPTTLTPGAAQRSEVEQNFSDIADAFEEVDDSLDAKADASDLTSHEADTAPHSATAAATANRLALRDGSGRLAVAAGAASGDAVNKGQLDTVANDLAARVGAPVADIAALRAVASAGLGDKQMRLVEGAGCYYRWDSEGTGTDDGALIVQPTDIPSGPGRWFKGQSATSNHNALIGLQGGDTDDYQHLTTEELARVPSEDVADALAGTDGTPGAGNKFVTDSDPRLDGGGVSVPTGTGFRHVTAGAEDGAAKLVENADVHASAGIVESKLALAFATHDNSNDPTAGEKDALAGLGSGPSDTNRYLLKKHSAAADFTLLVIGGGNPDTGAPASDGYRIRYELDSIGDEGTSDAFVIESLDGNADTPDNGLKFQVVNQSNVVKNRMWMRNSQSHFLKCVVVGPGTADDFLFLLIDNGSDDDIGFRWNQTLGKIQYSHNGTTWVSLDVGGGGGGSALARDTAVATTASIAHLAEEATLIEIGKSAMVLSVETDRAARVRVYISDAKRDADAGRDVLDAPPQNSGLLFEVLTTGAETVPFAPAVNAWNFEDPESADLFALIQNRSGSTAAVEVTVTKITLEA